jgi:hypothetical protein
MRTQVLPKTLVAGLSVFAWALTAVLAAQTAQPTRALDPPYLAGFPSVDAVKLAVRGSDPTDTTARQVAILYKFEQLVLRMEKLPGRSPNSETQDERRLSLMFHSAYYELSLTYARAPNAKAIDQLVAKYSADAALTNQMLGLLAPATLTEYGKLDAAASAQAQASMQASIDYQKRAAVQPPPTTSTRTPAAPPVAAAAASSAPAGAVRNDPGTLAARRCLELGGGELECMGKGITTGIFDLAGLPNVNTDVITAGPGGLRMGGTYQGGSIAISFTSDTLTVSGCGKLVADGRGYSVSRRGDQLDVTIQNEPKPLVLTLGPDKRFTGPAALDLTGRVIAGYRKYWVEERRVSDNSIIPGSGHEESEPIYEPRTERCGFASFRSTANVSSDTSMLGLVVGIAGGQADPAAQQSGTQEAPAGPRMSGTYAGGGGLQVEFKPTAVILDCGEAHVMRPYAVDNTANGLVVTIRNGTVPVPLTLGANGVLSGSGSVDVTGRVVTGTNATGVTFEPRTAKCSVGDLRPR